MERLQASQSPYSRSHNRRLKRKEKQQLGSGMDDLNAVLGAIDDPVEEVQQPGITTARRRDTSNEKPRVKPGQIGEGRGAPLTKAQRKKALWAVSCLFATIEIDSDFFSQTHGTSSNTPRPINSRIFKKSIRDDSATCSKHPRSSRSFENRVFFIGPCS